MISYILDVLFSAIRSLSPKPSLPRSVKIVLSATPGITDKVNAGSREASRVVVV